MGVIGSSWSSELGEPHRKRGGKNVGIRRDRGHPENMAHCIDWEGFIQVLRVWRVPGTEPARLCSRSCVYLLAVRCFVGLARVGGFSDSFACFLDTFSLTGLLSSQVDRRAFALTNCIFFCCVWLLSLGGLFFSEGKVGSGSGGEGKWGRREVRDTMFRIHSLYERRL